MARSSEMTVPRKPPVMSAAWLAAADGAAIATPSRASPPMAPARRHAAPIPRRTMRPVAISIPAHRRAGGRAHAFRRPGRLPHELAAHVRAVAQRIRDFRDDVVDDELGHGAC